MKVYIAIIISIYSFLACYGQAWEKYYGGAYGEYANKNVESIDGNYYVSFASRTTALNTKDDLAIMKLNSYGDQIWARYMDIDNNVRVFDIAATSDSGCIITGSSFPGAANYTCFLLKIDKNGRKQWSKNYLSATSYSEGRTVIETATGGFIVAGNVKVGAPIRSLVFEVDDTGGVVWANNYNKSVPVIDYAYGIQKLVNDYIVAGIQYAPAGLSLMRINDTDSIIWANIYNDGNGYSFPNNFTLNVTPDSNLLIAAFYGATFTLQKVSANGQLIWSKNYPKVRHANGLVTSDVTSYQVLCITDSFANGTSNPAILTVDSSGAPLNLSIIQTTGNAGLLTPAHDVLNKLSDGSFLITSSYSTANGDILVVKTDPTGLACSYIDTNVTAQTTSPTLTTSMVQAIVNLTVADIADTLFEYCFNQNVICETGKQDDTLVISVCANSQVDIIAPDHYLTYNWSTGDSTEIITYTATDSTTLSVIISNGNCFSDTFIYIINAIENDVVDAGSNDTIFAGDTISLNETSGLSVVWDSSSFLSCLFCSNPSAWPDVTTTFVVRSTDTVCGGIDSITIYVLEPDTIIDSFPSPPSVLDTCTEIFFANAFSPNDDLLNDLLTLNSDSSIFELSLYTRRGELIYHAKSGKINLDFKELKIGPSGLVYYLQYLDPKCGFKKIGSLMFLE